MFFNFPARSLAVFPLTHWNWSPQLDVLSTIFPRYFVLFLPNLFYFSKEEFMLIVVLALWARIANHHEHSLIGVYSSSNWKLRTGFPISEDKTVFSVSSAYKFAFENFKHDSKLLRYLMNKRRPIMNPALLHKFSFLQWIWNCLLSNTGRNH